MLDSCRFELGVPHILRPCAARQILMNKRLLFGIAVTLALGALPAIALPQAAAEYAAAAGSAASLTAKTASGLAQGSQQLAGRIQERMSKPLQSESKESRAKQENRQKVERKRPNSDAVVGSNSVPGEATIVSIQGAEVACVPESPKTSKGVSDTQLKDSACRRGNLSLKPEVRSEEKSVITLSFRQ